MDIDGTWGVEHDGLRGVKVVMLSVDAQVRCPLFRGCCLKYLTFFNNASHVLNLYSLYVVQ